MWCVDIRKYFNCPPAPSGDGDDFLVIDEDSINDAVLTDRFDLKPTRVGLGFRIREWRVLKEIASIIESIVRTSPTPHRASMHARTVTTRINYYYEINLELIH